MVGGREEMVNSKADSEGMGVRVQDAMIVVERYVSLSLDVVGRLLCWAVGSWM